MRNQFGMGHVRDRYLIKKKNGEVVAKFRSKKNAKEFLKKFFYNGYYIEEVD